MYYRWGEGDLLFADMGGEYVTSLSIGLVTLCGVLTVWLCVCMREHKHRHALFPWAPAEDSRYGVNGIKKSSYGTFRRGELKGKQHKLRWKMGGVESREVLLTSAFNLS